MDKETNVIIPRITKAESIVTKISIPPILYKRAVNFMKVRGSKESILLIMALDEFLTKNNF